MKIQYLVREITLETPGEMTTVLSLKYVSADRNGSVLTNLEINDYEKEIANAIYINQMTLRKGLDNEFAVIHEC